MIKKAVGLILSLSIVIGVLSAFGVRFYLRMQENTMRSVFSENMSFDGEEPIENQEVEQRSDDSKTNEILLLVLLVALASSIIFGIMLASDIRNNKITKEKLNTSIQLLIQKELQKKKEIDTPETEEQTFVPIHKPTRFELGGFVDSEVNRLLITDFTPANKKMTVMTDMNSLSYVIEYITNKIGDSVKLELVAELAALIVFSGDNLSFDDEEIRKLNKIMSDATGSFVFEDDKAIIKLPIIPEF